MLKWAFMFVQSDADSQKSRATVNTPTSNLTVIGVKDHNEAAKTAKSLVGEGVKFIELCGGFGPVGTAKILEAVGDQVPVGSISYGVESMGSMLAVLKELE